MTSLSGNIFRVTGPLCGEFTGHRWIPLTKASDVGLWCFLWSAPWINDWVNNREAGDLRHHRAHYDVIVMTMLFIQWRIISTVGLFCIFSYDLRVNFTYVSYKTLTIIIMWSEIRVELINSSAHGDLSAHFINFQNHIKYWYLDRLLRNSHRTSLMISQHCFR